MAPKPDLGPAVIDGVLKYVSPSSVAKYNPAEDGGCPRKYWLRYVQRLPDPPRKSTEIGLECHAQIEHYLRTGEEVFGPIVRAGAEHIPQPHKRLLIEDPITRLRPAGVPMVGFIDVVDTVVYEAPKGLGVEARDWKTTKDVARYAKSEDQLVATTQMSAYGYELALRYPDVQFVRLTHVYFGTARRESKKVSVDVSLDILERRWQSIESLVREIHQLAGETDVSKVPANGKACEAMGGCPYISHCPMRRNPFMGLVDNLRSKQGNAGGSDAEKMALLEAQIAALRAQAAQPVETRPEQLTQPPPEGDGITDATAAIRSAIQPQPIQPQPIQPPPPVQTPIQPQPIQPQPIQPPPPPPIQAPVPTPPPAQAEPAARRGPGRPRKMPPITDESTGVATKVTRVSLRHASTVNLGNYQSAKVEIELEGEVHGGGTQEAIALLSEQLRAALARELLHYLPAGGV